MNEKNKFNKTIFCQLESTHIYVYQFVFGPFILLSGSHNSLYVDQFSLMLSKQLLRNNSSNPLLIHLVSSFKRLISNSSRLTIFTFYLLFKLIQTCWCRACDGKQANISIKTKFRKYDASLYGSLKKRFSSRLQHTQSLFQKTV